MCCGKVLRSFREKSDLSQEKLAEKADLDRSYISLIENGRSGLSLETLFDIADAMDVGILSIITELEAQWREESSANTSTPDGGAT